MNKDIIYQEHGEMQKLHYQALSDPMYRMEMMMDVLFEETMMNMPIPFFQEPTPDPIVRNVPYKVIDQLQSQVRDLRREIQRLTIKKKDYY